MNTQSVLIGEIVLGGEPRIALYAETPIPLSAHGIAVLKDKLVNILDTRFQPAAPPSPSDQMTIDEVIALWGCHRVTVLKRMEAGLLHPINRGEELVFDRAEVERLGR